MWWTVALALILVSIGASTLGLKVSSTQTTIGDEARFGQEARGAIAVTSPADSAPDGISVTVRSYGVLTTSDLFGGPVSHQPGPAAHVAALPFVRLLGNRVGLWTFAIAVNIGALAIAGWVAFRQLGRLAGGLVMVGGLFVARLTTGTLASALNVHIVVLPSFAAFIVAWGLAKRDLVMLPVLAALVSFIVQTHIGYGVTPLLVSAGAIVLIADASTLRRLRTERILGWTLAVLGVAWLLPLLDQLVGTGNLRTLLLSDLPHSGLSGAWNGLGVLLRLPPLAQPSPDALAPPSALALVVGILLVAMLVRHRRQAMPDGRLLVIALAAIAGALLTSALSPPVGIASYHLHWIGLTVGCVATAGGLSAARSISTRHRESSAALGIVLLSITMVAVPLVDPAPDPGSRHVMEAVNALDGQLAEQLDRGDTVSITSRGGWTAEEAANGLAVHLADSGFATRQNATSGRGERAFIVATGSIDPGGRATAVASFGDRATSSRHLAQRVLRYVEEHQPLRLANPSVNTLVSYLDGRTADICSTNDELDAEALGQISPEAIVGLYAHGEVAAPILPDDLHAEVDQWRNEVDFTIYEVPAGVRYEVPAFSSDGCPPR
ncbi:MAG: hypothetical protein JWO77_116 [Ilumatobacteraceae bacterium]|nr:hypothetical protein [Ilumatobacteraceae bacterium]